MSQQSVCVIYNDIDGKLCDGDRKVSKHVALNGFNDISYT
jgi:hypothetical protein